MSVWGHGAAFLPKVKGKLTRGIIIKVGVKKRKRDTFTQGGILQTNKHTQGTGARYTG